MSRTSTRKTKESAAQVATTGATAARAAATPATAVTPVSPHRSNHDSSPLVSPHRGGRSTYPNSATGLVDQHHNQDQDHEDREHIDAKKLKMASVILFVCILSFVLQTELTKFVQTSMGYQKPYFILYISHSFWAIALPVQFLYSAYLSPTAPRSLCTFQDRADYFSRTIRQSTSDLYHHKADYSLVASGAAAPTMSSSSLAGSIATVYTSREERVLSRYLFWVTFGMTTLFMVPSYLWYTCVAMTSMANLTAIYNTACFFAYLFSVLLLREKIVLNKVLAVFLSLFGVAVITLTMGDSSSPDDDGTTYGKKHAAVSLVGDVLALVGAALYGFEEVIYKKYASPKVQPVVFANILTGLMGVVTCTMLWVPIPLLHWMGHEIFELPTLREFSSILMIATLGLIYNGCFMIVVSQTSPVFAAVGVMATIPLVALTDWMLFKETVGWGNVVGGLSILAGFAILVRENRKAA